MALPVSNAGDEGLSYFLHRAAVMSLEDARNVLKLETTMKDSYCGAWKSAEAIYCEKAERFPNRNWNLMPRECCIALTCYTLDRPSSMARRLNACCRGAQPTASSWELFPYKSLWCFLLRAFEMLPEFQVTRVFRVVETIGENPCDRVLFTEFVSGSILFQDIHNGESSQVFQQVFNFLPAHLVRDISMYSTREYLREVLIWPFCTFKVSRMSSESLALDFCRESLPRHIPRQVPAWSWMTI